MAPKIRFVRGSHGQRLATAVDGAGPPLVFPAWWVSHVERDVAAPRFRAFFDALAAHHTVVRYDRAGVGLSDRARERFELDDEVADLEAVLDGLGIARASFLGISCGAPTAITLAARAPGRVERLIVFNGYLRGAGIGRPEVQAALVALVRASWGLGSRALCDMFYPGASPEEAERFAEDQRHSASAEMSARLLELTYAMDARAYAPAVRAPTVVMHRRGDRAIAFEHGREVAAAIPGAELIALEGREHVPWAGDSAAVLAALGLGGGPRVPPPRDDDEPELTRDGEVWRVRWGGRTVHARHSRGLDDLALLLAHPGHRFAAVELVAAGSGEPAPSPGGAPILDATARAQFRARLAELEAELAGASPERAARLEAEREALVGELRAATGLGGRRRSLGDDAERARKAVTARLREAIARLGKLHPELGAHLEAQVETGVSCVYAPTAGRRRRT